MTKEEVTAQITDVGIIPAVRTSSVTDALFAVDAIFRAHIPVVELTMTTPGAVDLIGEMVRANPQAVVGAGTVLDLDTARCCLRAGAAFLTSPGLDLEIARFAQDNSIAFIPGALTPTEVMAASKAGASMIKVFPCAPIGGAVYIKALKGPFPHISFIASGGVSQQTAPDFVRAGAAALGIGEDLIPRDAIRLRNAAWIYELARRFRLIMNDGRIRHATHSGD